jgi:predicted phage tail protein
MNDELAPLLKALPEPAPPLTMTATVMARIAREADRRVEDQVTVPVRRGADVAAWLYSVTGAALVVVVFAYGWVTSGAMPDLTSARIGLGRPSMMPALGPFSALLGLGLLIYLAGLFSPLRSRARD